MEGDTWTVLYIFLLEIKAAPRWTKPCVYFPRGKHTSNRKLGFEGFWVKTRFFFQHKRVLWEGSDWFDVHFHRILRKKTFEETTSWCLKRKYLALKKYSDGTPSITNLISFSCKNYDFCSPGSALFRVHEWDLRSWQNTTLFRLYSWYWALNAVWDRFILNSSVDSCSNLLASDQTFLRGK